MKHLEERIGDLHAVRRYDHTKFYTASAALFEDIRTHREDVKGSYDKLEGRMREMERNFGERLALLEGTLGLGSTQRSTAPGESAGTDAEEVLLQARRSAEKIVKVAHVKAQAIQNAAVSSAYISTCLAKARVKYIMTAKDYEPPEDPIQELKDEMVHMEELRRRLVNDRKFHYPSLQYIITDSKQTDDLDAEELEHFRSIYAETPRHDDVLMNIMKVIAVARKYPPEEYEDIVRADGTSSPIAVRCEKPSLTQQNIGNDIDMDPPSSPSKRLPTFSIVPPTPDAVRIAQPAAPCILQQANTANLAIRPPEPAAIPPAANTDLRTPLSSAVPPTANVIIPTPPIAAISAPVIPPRSPSPPLPMYTPTECVRYAIPALGPNDDLSSLSSQEQTEDELMDDEGEQGGGDDPQADMKAESSKRGGAHQTSVTEAADTVAGLQAIKRSVAALGVAKPRSGSLSQKPRSRRNDPPPSQPPSRPPSRRSERLNA